MPRDRRIARARLGCGRRLCTLCMSGYHRDEKYEDGKYWEFAGHGLDYKNVVAIAKIPKVEELNIGYSIVTRALWVGLEAAVREMLALLS